MELRYSKNSIPFAAAAASTATSQQDAVKLVALRDGEVPAGFTRAELTLPSKFVLRGNYGIAQYIANLPQAKANLVGASVEESIEITQLAEFAATELATAEQLELSSQRLNHRLTFRTYLVGTRLSVADLIIFEALRSNAGWTAFKTAHGAQVPHLARWYSFMETVPAIQAALKDLMFNLNKRVPKAAAPTAAAAAASSSAAAASSSAAAAPVLGSVSAPEAFSLELPGAEEGKVVTRFPPEPSGFLHIGHAKAALINDFFARRYNGKIILRFDDTNPEKEKLTFEEAIRADLDTLGIKFDAVSYTSDFFPVIFEMGTKLIDQGRAYIDDTPVEELREQRFAGTASKRRDQPIAENQRMWAEMQLATEDGKKWCMRAKMDMEAKNKCLRDPILFRFKDSHHARTGDKYKVYPTYDFACPIVDSLEGVTHALRSSEYHDRNDQYYWMIDLLEIRKPLIWDYSRMNFSRTTMSKRKLQWFVDKKHVPGWNDPRFPTVQGLTRRGLTVAALREFVLSQGASKNLNVLEWEKLWSFNKKVVDPVCPRHVAIAQATRVPLVLSDGPATPEYKTLPKHKKNPEAGEKVTAYSREILLDGDDAVTIEKGEEVTLMDWGNAIIDNIVMENGLVSRLEGHLNLAGDFKKTKKKLTWLAATEDMIPVTLVDHDHLITKVKLEPDDKFEDFLTPTTRWDTPALGDANLRNLQRGDIIQLERRGFFICDTPYLRDSKPLVLFSFPDGRKLDDAALNVPKQAAKVVNRAVQ